MKIDARVVLMIIVALFIIDRYVFNDNKTVEDVTVITPEVNGTVEKKLDSVVPDVIYIDKIVAGSPKPVRKEIIVDSTYKAEYENAIKENDSLKAKNLFLESIALDTHEGTLIDNDDIKIDGRFLTRGKLLEYDIDYKIKSDTITYTPDVVYKHPNLSLVLGTEVSFPTNPSNLTNPAIGFKVGLQNKRGATWSVGVNTNKDVSIGYSKTFKLF
tara:strand:+ start:8174 stop:8815 length:642 start_codon:yes stop_codon:yes gene_type:complete